MRNYFRAVAESKITKKSELTLTALKKAVQWEDFFPEHYRSAIRLYNAFEWIKANQYDKESKTYAL